MIEIRTETASVADKVEGFVVFPAPEMLRSVGAGIEA
jgi:hypothetical protein